MQWPRPPADRPRPSAPTCCPQDSSPLLPGKELQAPAEPHASNPSWCPPAPPIQHGLPNLTRHLFPQTLTFSACVIDSSPSTQFLNLENSAKCSSLLKSGQLSLQSFPPPAPSCALLPSHPMVTTARKPSEAPVLTAAQRHPLKHGSGGPSRMGACTDPRSQACLQRPSQVGVTVPWSSDTTCPAPHHTGYPLTGLHVRLCCVSLGVSPRSLRGKC